MENKPINMKPLAMVGLLAASFSGIAADGDNIGTVTFTTAAEASILQEKALNFGKDLSVKSGITCTLDKELATTGAAAGEYILDPDTDVGAEFVDEVCGGDTAGTAAASLAAMQNSNVEPGIFKLSGSRNQVVSFKVEEASTDFLKFTPKAHYYDGATDEFTESAATPINDIAAGATTSLPLGTLRSIVQGQAHPQAVGTLVIVGTLETLQRLDTSKDYTVTYSLDVTYQ